MGSKSPDHKTYTFKIRENVKFHDGTPLTSADIKATLDKIVFPPERRPEPRKSWYARSRRSRRRRNTSSSSR